MKINKIFLMAAVAMLGLFASCGDDDDYTAGNKSGNYDVAFTEASQQNYALDLAATEFTVSLRRSNTQGALTVPLKAAASEMLSVPSSVTFADGSATADITIGVSDSAKAFVNYPLLITVPEEYTQQYDSAATVYPRLQVTVHKEDWKPSATGTFTSSFFAASWGQELQYSAYLKIYRLPDLYAEGYHFYFKWNGATDDTQEFEMTDANGITNVAATESGAVHKTYGMMYATWLSEYDSGILKENTFYIPFKWTVAAGTFDNGSYEKYVISKWY